MVVVVVASVDADSDTVCVGAPDVCVCRVEVLTVARAELESRCANLTVEMREQAIAHESTVAQLQQQLTVAHEELNRLRTQAQNLRALQVQLETANAEQAMEIQELRRRLSEAEMSSKSSQQELQAARAAKKRWEERCLRSERRCQLLQEARARDFEHIEESTLRQVREHFVQLRLGLNVDSALRASVDGDTAADGDDDDGRGSRWSQQSSPMKSPTSSATSPSPRRSQQPPTHHNNSSSSGGGSAGLFHR